MGGMHIEMGDPPTVPTGPSTRLAEALDAEDGSAARRVLGGLASTGEGQEAVPGLADLLAGRAAAGSWLAVELLAESVDELDLARKAVRRLLVDEAAVDDVAQDTLVSMASSIRSFRGEARFTTWLYRIARNRVVDHLRRQRFAESLGDDDVGEAQRISSVIASRDAARALVARLPERYRHAVVLRDVERLSYTDAAQRLGLNVNTVKSHVARGRALLARALVDGRAG